MALNDWRQRYRSKICTAQEAVQHIKRGDTVFIGTACGEPQALVRAMVAEADSMADNEIIQTLSLGATPYADEKYSDQFRLNALFIGPGTRQAVNTGRADYTPIYLSEIEGLFERGAITIEVALIQVSPPDDDGNCSLGVSVDITKSAAEHADVVIAQVNENMPRTRGDSFIHVDEIDHLVDLTEPLLEWHQEREEDPEVLAKIGKHLSELVNDGSTIQIGYGTTPNAVLRYLRCKRDLGVHTEVFSDGLMQLVLSGVVTGRKKTIHQGKIVASFLMGTKGLYEWANDNDMIEMHPSSYTNDPFVISRNDDMVAINTALSVDLTGQVCADQIGHKFFSGLGGQVDFLRGAARSRNGRPIIALPSTAKDGSVSRIVPHLEEGDSVTTPRGDVHYVVTEYGVAELHGKSIMQRALALIEIAHPKFRDELLAHAKTLHLVYPDQIGASIKSVYPEQYEMVARLADLDVYIRPAKASDEAMLRDLFYSFSDTTVYSRYMAPRKRFSHTELSSIVDIDYVDRMTFIALIKEKGSWKAVGVSTFDLDRTTNTAEVSFIVADRMQGKGIGTKLMEQMIKAGRDRSIKAFTAETLAQNVKMLDIFYRTGFKVETKLVEDTYMVKMDLWQKV
ncbi:MAG: GNAT family N-acetyltransferase [Methanomassiliicoccales archaeon]|nr:MAG: GNAT family N-acetyltransferase [Methanomassiliicoccales archaeon]